MNRTLHEADNAQRILKLTADTMLLVDRNGICIDIDIHSNLWFLQEERLLGKNIFERMPEHTREKVYSTFQTVLREQRSISKNYKLELEDNTYYFLFMNVNVLKGIGYLKRKKGSGAWEKAKRAEK